MQSTRVKRIHIDLSNWSKIVTLMFKQIIPNTMQTLRITYVHCRILLKSCFFDETTKQATDQSVCLLSLIVIY